MNIGGLPDLILTWLRSQGAEQSQAGKESSQAQFKPGMQYEGKVLDALPNGRNLVQIGNQTMDMALPRKAGPGDIVRLTFLNSAPRPTFALNDNAPASAQPVNVSRTAQQVSALVRYMPVSAPAPAASPPAAAASAAAPADAHAARAMPTAAAGPSTNQIGAAISTAAKLATTIHIGQAGHDAQVASRAAQASVNLAQTAGNVAQAAGNAAQTVGVAAQASGVTAQAGAAVAPGSLARNGTVAAPGRTTPTATGNPARAGNAALATTSAAAAQGSRPIVANPALLLAPVSAGVNTATPGPGIPAMTMAGEAVDEMRAALGSNSTLTTAQGVVAEKSPGTHVLPMRLQQTVKESGLFYESHLGKWARGELSLESIQREPQARLAQMPGPLLNLPDLEGMPEEAARFASRQLHMLEGGPFLWQGQAWAGQMAEWLVREREAGEGNGEAGGQKWHSQLRLILPRLGDLSADLDIGAQGLRIRLKAITPETLAEMNAALPELVERLRTAELNLSSIKTELADGGQ